MTAGKNFIAVSRKIRKIDKKYLSDIDSFITYLKQKKEKWVAQVKTQPKMLDVYDSLRLSIDILENYKGMVAIAGPGDNPKVIDYALPTLECVEGCLELIDEIDSKIKKKNFDLLSYKTKAKTCSVELQEIGKSYLTDFDSAIQKIPKKSLNSAVTILNKEIGQEF